ncbi:hypothetical protein ACHAXA_005854 [Cyclostephanos tholiformis]|uniref:Uncharacterized protein n=1 Tax=Cyclostephanos tholiformis TaxID=382380 RepID=A0ABD3RDL3_9STRA
MSLATTGGGGGFSGAGGAGLSVAAMAHGGPNAANAVAAQQPIHSHHGIPGSGGGGPYGAAPGTGYAALGADLLDRTQSLLSARAVRNSANMPLVAMDLYGDDCGVAYFPPHAPDDDDEDDDNNDGNGGEKSDDPAKVAARDATRLRRGNLARYVGGYHDGTDLVLKKDDQDAYRAVRRYLNKGEGHSAVLDDAVVSIVGGGSGGDGGGTAKEGTTTTTIVIPRPHLILGARRIDDINDAARAGLASLLPPADGENGGGDAAIDRDDVDDDRPVSVTTINMMDGNATGPKGDDSDRVAYRLRLNSRKKVVTMLPEEALALIVLGCKSATRVGCYGKREDDGQEQEGGGGEYDEYSDYPTAFAVPGWAAMDSCVEALIDASNSGASSGACGPTLHQRSVAALVGALLPPRPAVKKSAHGRAIVDPKAALPQPSLLHKSLSEVIASKDAESRAALARAGSDPEGEEFVPFVPMVVLVGATREGIEITAMCVSKPQSQWPNMELHCPYGNVSVVSSVCHASSDPLGILKSTLDELRAQVGKFAPESEEPTCFITYGSISTQVKLATGLKAALMKYGIDGKDDDDWDGWDADIPILSTREDCVSLGLAVLAASVHGRVRLAVSEKGKDGKNRTKAKLAVAVQDASPCAVAVSFNYFGGGGNDSDTWTEPKVIFDFDRRVPAGPYQIDFTAAECAAHVKQGKFIEDENILIDMAKGLEGSWGIPKREEAALKLRFRIYQKTSRGGAWIRVGDDMLPLTIKHSQKEESESGDGDLVAIESAVLEISLNGVGMLTTKNISNNETIVQATKSARNSKLLRWGTIIGTISFMGFFFVKSYVDERVFDRDTERVLAYYKRAAKNSMHDGDVRGARYLVWKYKGKKDKLWRRLEAKYGIPVRHAWEWDDEEDEGGNKHDGAPNEEEEAEDLDDVGTEKTKGGDGDEL